MKKGRSVILEFIPVGAYVKVSAVDPDSLTEVSIVGDPAAGEAALEATALRKLRYVLARRAGRDRRRPVASLSAGSGSGTA